LLRAGDDERYALTAGPDGIFYGTTAGGAKFALAPSTPLIADQIPLPGSPT